MKRTKEKIHGDKQRSRKRKTELRLYSWPSDCQPCGRRNRTAWGLRLLNRALYIMTSLHLSGHNISAVRTRRVVCFVFFICLRAQICLIHHGKNLQTTPPGLSTSGLLHTKKVMETFRVAGWIKRIFLQDTIKGLIIHQLYYILLYKTMTGCAVTAKYPMVGCCVMALCEGLCYRSYCEVDFSFPITIHPDVSHSHTASAICQHRSCFTY